MRFSEGFAELGIKLVHHFADGLYAKETVIPAGRILHQHVHSFDHLSILAQGRVRVTTADDDAEYEAPACILIKAGAAHVVRSITDATWYCVHSTGEKDPEKIDHTLVQDDNQ